MKEEQLKFFGNIIEFPKNKIVKNKKIYKLEIKNRSIPKDTPMVGVSLKDLANASKINILQAASKGLLS